MEQLTDMYFEIRSSFLNAPSPSSPDKAIAVTNSSNANDVFPQRSQGNHRHIAAEPRLWDSESHVFLARCEGIMTVLPGVY